MRTCLATFYPPADDRLRFIKQLGIDDVIIWATTYQTREEVMLLAKQSGRVAMPMTPMGLLGAFFTLCANKDEEPFAGSEPKIVNDAVGEEVLVQLSSLCQLIPAWCMDVYPPYIFNKMAASEEIWYVPVSYGYVNYSMQGYATHLVTAHNIPASGNCGCKGATLGGVGMAVSASTTHAREAVDFATWITGANCQKTVYAYSGGQPANSEAWKDATLNVLTNNFYSNTQATLEGAFMRPRYNGFHRFQSNAGRLLQAFLRKESTVSQTLNTLNSEYLLSKQTQPAVSHA